MIMRLLNICVIAALFGAAAYVYKIKYESTQRAELEAKLRTEIRREHDAIASLRAEWSRLDTPARIEELTRRHLALKPMHPHQFDRLDHLPERPPKLVPPGTSDPIGFLIELPELGEVPTASITPLPKSGTRGSNSSSNSQR
jgi:cell division protein FtsL